MDPARRDNGSSHAVAKGLMVASELLDEFLVVEAGAVLLADKRRPARVYDSESRGMPNSSVRPTATEPFFATSAVPVQPLGSIF
jgi:hypothetical protein